MKLNKQIKLLPFEWVMIIYASITTILTFILWNKLSNPMSQIIGRIAVVSLIVGLAYLADNKFKGKSIILLIRALLQITLLPFWYGDLYEFISLFPNLDHIFVLFEQKLFGMQPSVEYSKVMSQKWFSEANYLGYFFLYPMITGGIFFSFFTRKTEAIRLTTILMASFFTYYLIFVMLPVAGPQFYFLAIGMENVNNLVFPEIGYYFKNNTDIMPGPGYNDGFFYHLIELVQSGGERPIAAVPSSHVGISTVVMLWATNYNRKLCFILLPLYLLLCSSTVYIQAHYLIDVIGGWITGAIFYFFFSYLYKSFYKNQMI